MLSTSARGLFPDQLKITKTDKPEVTLDYGNDVCDRIATITIGDKYQLYSFTDKD